MSNKFVLFIVLINFAIYVQLISSDLMHEKDIPNISSLTINIPQNRAFDFYHNQVPSPDDLKREKKDLRYLNFNKKKELEYLEHSDEDSSIRPIRKKRCILQSPLPFMQKNEQCIDSDYDLRDSPAFQEEEINIPSTKTQTVKFLLSSIQKDQKSCGRFLPKQIL